MRNTLIVAALVVLAAGCTNQGESAASGTSAAAGAAASATEASKVPDEWELTRKASAMDGEIVQAQRIFTHPGDAKFVVDIGCSVSNKRLSMTVMSIVGDAESPAESSAFVATNGAFPGTLAPEGRVKGARDKAPTVAAVYFQIGDYSNQIRLWNGALGEDLPMVVEAKTGAGTFELVIDNSSSVQEVVRACGSPVSAETAAARALDQEVARTNADATAAQAAAMAAADEAANVKPAGANDARESVEPSFDCTKAFSKVEQMICADNRLSAYDSVLAGNYKAVLAANIGDDARSSLKAMQRSWLQSRDGCTDQECLAQLYRSRIDAVCETPVLSGAAPDCASAASVQ